MKGWQFTTTGVPLKMIEKADPKAGPGEVVIDIKAAGLCHSDVGALEDPGWLDIITLRPLFLGHEFAGVISEVGAGIKDFKIGDRVGVCPVGLGGTAPGYSRDGGYATKSVTPVEDLIRIPEHVSFAQAAAGTEADMSTLHAVKVQNRVTAGAKVGKIDIGSPVGTVSDIQGIYDRFESGKLNPEIITITFGEIAEGLKELKNQRVRGRLVALIE